MNPDEIKSAAAALGSLGGKARARSLSPERASEIGRLAGKARLLRMTPEQRSASARAAAQARWNKPQTPNDNEPRD